MSALTQVFLSGGVLVLVLIAIAMVYFGINQATEIALQGKIQSEKNTEAINAQNKAIDQFVNTWFNRINASNIIQNNTQDQLLNISHTLELRQDEHIKQNKNLTILLQDRTQLFDDIKESIVNLTQVNEVERGKAVEKILNTVGNNTILLEQLLEQQKNNFDSTGSIAGIK